MRKLLLFFAMLSVSIGAWAKPVEQDQETGRWYIGGKPEGNYFTIENGVAIFHVAYKTEGPDANKGVIADSWNEISQKLGGVTRIKFANDCLINQADLECFLGTQNATYYVDLFDITNGENTPMKIDNYTTEADDNNANNIDKIIEATVANMVTRGWQAKGIILPLNTGSGTTKVEKANNNDSRPTFTDYAAYYRENTDPNTAAIYAHYEEMKNGWQNVTSHQEAQSHYETAYAHLTEHAKVADATTYIVSTNSRIKNSDEPLNLDNITTEGATKISIVNDELVYTANPGERSLLSFISVQGAKGGDFAAAVRNTGIDDTPCEELTVRGPVTSADVAAINEFNKDGVEGPHIYNLANATGVAKTDLASITNTRLEYIILPPTMAEEQLEKDVFSQSLTNSTTFKAAVAASDDKKKLSAYVNVAGSLAKARCYATGNSSGNAGQFVPTTQNLTSVILGGNLNANDIGSNQDGQGLKGEKNSLTSIDLEKAFFANADHMKLGDNGGAGLTNLTEVKLPTDNQMKIIPSECFHNVRNLQSIHIPYNFMEIKARAFEGTDLTHITTEDANGALIDNGPNTYTFSANITVLGEPNQNNYVFPEGKLVTDVFCLAMTTPKCYKGSFPPNMVYANGGIYDGVYCREKYIKYDNSDPATGNPVSAITMLHFPSQESYKNATGDNTDDGYNNMQSLYTDPSRNYAKKDQTGAVDANGKPLTWPDQGECRSTHDDLALKGYLWSNYPQKDYETSGDGHLKSLGNRTGDQGAFYSDYVGWHEFVLACATYFEPDEIIENEKIVREYEETGYYTFCIPFNMNYNQVVEMLGVPKSTDKVINKLNGKAVDKDYMPEIRQLSSVTRKKGADGKSNIVFLRMTPNLYGVTVAGYTSYLSITYNENSETHQLPPAEPYNNSSPNGEELSLIGGRPYIIKAYKRKQLDENGVDLFKIKGQNLGKYVMEHYADQFGVESSIVENRTYEQFLCYEQLYNNKQNENERAPKTLRFAKPYEGHRIQAVRDGENSAYLTYETDENGNTVTKKYFYTMVGQFWQQPLPQYCLYMSKGNWYRYTTLPADPKDRYTWDPFKCVIMATEEIAGTKGEGYRDEENSNYPKVIGQTDDKLDGVFSLAFLDGRDDDDFEGNGTSAKYMFMLDDDIVEIDDEGNVVSTIKQLDGEMVPATVNTKVYNMAGQYVGNRLQGLSKGMYVVNGKKYIVK